MAFDNKDLEAEVTQLTMRSNGIALDENGRITFLDSGILETIVAGARPKGVFLDSTNTYQCINNSCLRSSVK
jgi:hypothetical protein